MKKIEDYLTQINTAQTSDQAFQIFSGIVKDYGYDRLVYTLLTDHPSIGLNSKHGMVVSYPKDWMKHYQEKQYLSIDPVHLQVLTSPLPFFWSKFRKDETLKKSSRTMMNEAGEAGIKDGAGIPLYGRIGEIAGVGLARNETDGADNYENLAALQLISAYFHESYKGLVCQNEYIHLSEKERELLVWAAEGKSDQDISEILHIRLPTVRYRWNNIFRKLDAYGRVYAVTKAIRLQLITPYRIVQNYQKR